jgi:glycosyltransferase involved in cell wall biosynthesis
VIAPYVSIVLPTRNGAATLPSLFDAFARQRVDFPFEVVAVDSSSSDGTGALLRQRADRLVTIGADAFDHGLTRNLAIEHARGELIVLTVQDALPASDTWLAALTSPLRIDDGLAGTFARQIARLEASAVTRYALARWAGASDVPRTSSVSNAREFEALDPAAKFERCIFDNVCACIRRSVWCRHRFHQTPIGEDVEWARDVLLAGYRLAYTPEAAVIHSHDRSARYEFARTYILHRRLHELFGLRTIPTPYGLARAIGSSVHAHLRCEKSARAIALAVAWPLGQYLGALSAVRGWKPLRSRIV